MKGGRSGRFSFSVGRFWYVHGQPLGSFFQRHQVLHIPVHCSRIWFLCCDTTIGEHEGVDHSMYVSNRDLSAPYLIRLEGEVRKVY